MRWKAHWKAITGSLAFVGVMYLLVRGTLKALIDAALDALGLGD